MVGLSAVRCCEARRREEKVTAAIAIRMEMRTATETGVSN